MYVCVRVCVYERIRVCLLRARLVVNNNINTKLVFVFIFSKCNFIFLILCDRNTRETHSVMFYIAVTS